MRSLLLRHQTFGGLIQLADHLIFCVIDCLKATDDRARRGKHLRMFLLHHYERVLDSLAQAIRQVLAHDDRIVGNQFGDPDDAQGTPWYFAFPGQLLQVGEVCRRYLDLFVQSPPE